VVLPGLNDSNVIRLSVDTNTVLSVFYKFYLFSSAFSIASCSAWLFEHRPFNLYFVVSVRLLLGYHIIHEERNVPDDLPENSPSKNCTFAEMFVFLVILRKHSHGVLEIRLEFRTVTFLRLSFTDKCPSSFTNSS
jgi:hypothetical protein